MKVSFFSQPYLLINGDTDRIPKPDHAYYWVKQIDRHNNVILIRDIRRVGRDIYEGKLL